jgi:hypothetical protein
LGQATAGELLERASVLARILKSGLSLSPSCGLEEWWKAAVELRQICQNPLVSHLLVSTRAELERFIFLQVPLPNQNW